MTRGEKPLNVLMLTKHRLSSFGVAEVIHRLSRELIHHGITPYCYSSDESANDQPFGPDIPCFHGPLPRPGKWWTDRGNLQPLRRLVRERDIHLIHCHNIYRPGYAARMLSRRANLPYVLTSHGEMSSETSDRPRRASVRRRCAAILRAAAAVTHLTPHMAEQARAFNVQPALERVIPNGVDLAWWSEGTPAQTDATDPSTPEPRTLLTVSRLDQQKAVDLVVAAAADASRRQPLALVIAGTGPARESLMQQARDEGMQVSEQLTDALHPRAGMACFPGMVTGETKRRLFARSWAVTLSSQKGEAFPVVLLEALAAGRAVIASDIPAIRAVLDDTGHGLAVNPPHDPAAWAEAVHRLWTDDSLYHQLVAAGRRAAPRFDWPLVARQYVSLYEQALARAA